MELNQGALIAARDVYHCSTSLQAAIKAYLESIEAQKTPKPVPFDASKVKPGDEVICDACRRFYIGVNKRGFVVVEDIEGRDWSYSAASVTIPPKPKTTVKVAIFQADNGARYSLTDDNVFATSSMRISNWVEIPIEGGEA